MFLIGSVLTCVTIGIACCYRSVIYKTYLWSKIGFELWKHKRQKHATRVTKTYTPAPGQKVLRPINVSILTNEPVPTIIQTNSAA